MPTAVESKILEIVAERQLLSKSELKHALNGVSSAALENATQSLTEKKLITTLNSIGYTCFAITQQGSKFLNEL